MDQLGDPGEPVELIEDSLGTFNDSMLTIDYLISELTANEDVRVQAIRMTARMANRAQQIEPFYVMKILQQARELESQGKSIIHMEIGEPDFAVAGNGNPCRQAGTGQAAYPLYACERSA